MPQLALAHTNHAQIYQDSDRAYNRLMPIACAFCNTCKMDKSNLNANNITVTHIHVYYCYVPLYSCIYNKTIKFIVFIYWSNFRTAIPTDKTKRMGKPVPSKNGQYGKNVPDDVSLHIYIYSHLFVTYMYMY